MEQQTPDAGETNFWYNSKGQLMLSQNTKQAVAEDCSFTKYDALGRISMVGELENINITNLATLVENANFVEDNNLMAVAHDITQTIYDLKVVETGVQQRYLRNRVSAVYRYEDNAAMIAKSGNATIYSYDELGNVNVLVQKLVVNNEVYVKQVRYEYDLQSGKVNKVTFQKGAIDQYSHRYEYDADNRITDVYTSRDGRFESRDAKYFYYPHGPLARVELGDGKVQGVDYVYTLQGWLKGTGSQDGEMGLNNFIAPGEVSYILGYYENDYQSITSSSVDAFALSQLTPYYNNTSHQVNGHKGLFNGNIALMATMIRHFGETDFNEAYNINEYQYDQLNRIKNCDGRRFTMYPYITNTVSMSYNYDPNGNITHLVRNGIDASGTTLDMDELTYGYSLSGGKLVNNRLSHVDDAIIGTNSNNFDNDIEDQSTGNYEYDEIGNLIGDQAEEIDEIVWDVYGKIKSINFDTKSDLDFQYDPMGNRIAKIVKNGSTGLVEKTTLYFRDAQGNVLMTEEILAAVTNNIKGSREFAIYGSSRLGVYTEDVLDVLPPAAPNEYEHIVGLRAYELSNHLGNVLATISDYKSNVVETAIDPITQQIIITDFYYEAVVLTASDYDPFGTPIGFRTFNGGGYRFGFNGKENDNDVYGVGNCVAFEARIFDPRLGRFLSIDPLWGEYLYWSPYCFSGNSPLKYIEDKGQGPLDAIIYKGLEKYGGLLVLFNESHITLGIGGLYAYALRQSGRIYDSKGITYFKSKGTAAGFTGPDEKSFAEDPLVAGADIDVIDIGVIYHKTGEEGTDFLDFRPTMNVDVGIADASMEENMFGVSIGLGEGFGINKLNYTSYTSISITDEEQKSINKLVGWNNSVSISNLSVKNVTDWKGENDEVIGKRGELFVTKVDFISGKSETISTGVFVNFYYDQSTDKEEYISWRSDDYGNEH